MPRWASRAAGVMPAIPAPDRAAVAGDAELRKPFHEGVLQRRKPRHHRNKGVAHFVERWEADDILLAPFPGSAHSRYILESPPLVSMGRARIVGLPGAVVQR